jgi:xanthine/CO dehydrogenase XdhC/CoxF family maturation factor
VTNEHRYAARVAPSLQEVRLHAGTFAVHTDHEAAGLAEDIAWLLRSPAAFIGVMGSSRHVGPHLRQLEQMGFGEADLARVRTPVGLDIGARTSTEIALSILAGLIAARHGRDGGWLDRRTAG